MGNTLHSKAVLIAIAAAFATAGCSGPTFGPSNGPGGADMPGGPAPTGCADGSSTPSSTTSVSTSKGNYKLYVPDNVCKVRCVYLHPHEEQYDFTTDPAAQASAQRNACALLQIDFTIDIGTWHNASRGSGQDAVDALTQLATSSGHPELTSAFYVPLGFSAAAFWATTMWHAYPQKTLTVASWHGARQVTDGGNDVAASAKVPALIFGGLCDQTCKWPDEVTAWNSTRSLGGPTTLALELIGHSPQNCGTLTWPYFDTIIPLRLPPQSTSLSDIDPASGYLGNNDSGDFGQTSALASGDPKTFSWLPSESFAQAWKQFVTDDGSKNGSNRCRSGPQPPR